MPRSSWTHSEVEILMENYAKSTTDELLELLPRKSRKSISRKIEELRSEGLIEYRDKRTVNRAYRQRSRPNRPGKQDRRLPLPTRSGD